MATYAIINITFLLATALALKLRLTFPSAKTWCVLGILLLLTAVFDSMLVGLNIVAYDTSLISGIYIGNAPIEDFFYSLLAVMVIPVIWRRLGEKNV